MGLDVAVSAEALSDVQFSIAARLGRHHPVVVEPGPALHVTTQSATGDGPKTPERGCRLAGTSLLNLGRVATC